MKREEELLLQKLLWIKARADRRRRAERERRARLNETQKPQVTQVLHQDLGSSNGRMPRSERGDRGSNP